MREPLPERTAFQMSYNTDLDFYEYLERDDMKVEREAFHRFMKTNMTGLPSWLDKVDIKSELTDGLTDTDVAFVDVGGGNGHQCVELKEKIPDLPGRVILQDRPDILAKSLDAEGIEKMEYDYNNEQPIKGKLHGVLTTVHRSLSLT